LDLQLPLQSVPVTTKVVCSNPVHGDVYTEQNHVIKIDNALLQVGGFLGNSTNKTDHNDVTEILSLNTISITHTSNHMTVRYIDQHVWFWFYDVLTPFSTIFVLSWRSVLLVEETGENQYI
jgi:hypothetical protein